MLGKTQRAVLESVRDHHNPMTTLENYPHHHSYEVLCRRASVIREMVRRGYIRDLPYGNPEATRLQREAVKAGKPASLIPTWALTPAGAAALLHKRRR